jgi:transcriptional regulator with XRE-family HTH domain
VVPVEPRRHPPQHLGAHPRGRLRGWIAPLDHRHLRSGSPGTDASIKLSDPRGRSSQRRGRSRRRCAIDEWEGIGELLGRTRAEQGISQLRLAERLCASSGTPTVTRHEISRWEREERIPTGYWLNWLAVALDLPVDRLERAAAFTRRRRRRPDTPPTWYEYPAGVYTRVAS